MFISSWQPADRDAAADLIVSIQASEFGLAITRADQPDLENVAGFYQQGAGGFWCARDGDLIVGTIALKDIGAGQGALRKMFVAQDYRGPPHRTAQRLLDHLVAHARDQGLNAIILGTTPLFLAAHRFYEKNGFVRLPPDRLPSTFPRMPLDDRFYRLGLEA